jgi:hypothetical protein
MIGSVLLSVAVVHLLRVLAPTHRYWRTSFFVAAIAFILAELATYPSLVQKGRQLHRERSDAALFLEVSPYIDPATDDSEQSLLYPLFPVRPYTYMVRKPALLLNDFGFRRVVSNARFEEQPEFCGCLDSPVVTGKGVFPINSSSALPVTGWAVLPRQTRLPKIVLLSVNDQPTFIAGARVGTVDRPDVRVLMKNSALGPSGWATSWPAPSYLLASLRCKLGFTTQITHGF